MKKILIINGSPRKKWNTSTLLTHVKQGAESAGAQTDFFNLYDCDYKGCSSCFACKMIGGASFGRCAVKDGLTGLLEKADKADAIVVGSPIYLGWMSGETQSMMERLLGPYIEYTKPMSSLYKGRKDIGLIFTMNIPTVEIMSNLGVQRNIQSIESRYKLVFGSAESLCSLNTLQFEDYSKVRFEYLSIDEKIRDRKEKFPQDCKKAYEMGVRFAG